MNPELMNRAIIYPLDDSEKQTKKILQFYGKGSEREIKQLKGQIHYGVEYNKFKNALKLLKHHNVLIPFEEELMPLFPHKKPSSRRDALKFLDMIRGSCLLFQYQRPRMI